MDDTLADEAAHDAHLPTITEAAGPRVPVRSAGDLIREDTTKRLESLAQHAPERLAEVVREWIEE
jgi:flagellar biosynthesis/type III secretory pathway M-ring protein FliF/YscJ